MVSSQNFNSWKTLLRAAEIRKHAPILDVAKDLPDGEIPAVQYHRKCHSVFTMKKLLDSSIAKEDDETATGSSRMSSGYAC